MTDAEKRAHKLAEIALAPLGIESSELTQEQQLALLQGGLDAVEWLGNSVQGSSIIAAVSQAKRKIRGGGRPISGKPRCPCGANTLARATARSFECCKEKAAKDSLTANFHKQGR